MSVKVSSWVWHETPSEVRGNKLVALLALADIADDAGNCIYTEDTSQEALAEKSRMSVSQFREVTKWLEAAGYLSSERANRTSQKSYRIEMTADFRRSDSGGHTAGFRRSGAPVSGGRSFNDVLNVRDVISSSDAVASDGGELTPTGRPKKPTKSEADYHPEVIRLCRLLAILVAGNDHRVDTVGVRWWNACELLHRKDEYSFEQIEIMIRWATADPFWSANIRSMPTLREKFTTLRARRNSDLAKKSGAKPTPSSRALATIALGDELEAEQRAVSA